MALPYLASLYYYPVKGMTGIATDAQHPEPTGLRYDRRWMFVTPDGRFMSQRRFRELVFWDAAVVGTSLVFTDRRDPARAFSVADAFATDGPRIPVTLWDDRFEATHLDSPTVRRLATALGASDARLVYLGDPQQRPLDPAHAQAGEVTSLADAYPYLIVNAASVTAFEQHCDTPIHATRFRPNLVIAGAEPWAEDRWQRLQIGAHRFRIDKACGRCQVITIDQRTGEQRLELLERLRTLRRRDNRVIFGVYAVWEGGSDMPLRVSDSVVVELPST